MSEYQYYEFQAIDRRLTEKEMKKLRACSSRARITPTGFTNEYNWGDFKGDERAWMEKYFDAFMYLANWGVRTFMLRLPPRLLELDVARRYCAGESATAAAKNGNVILAFRSDEEGGGEWTTGDGWLASMISVRSELAQGDMRCLYLSWLLCAQSGELENEDEEPPVPPGLGELSASQESFAEFLKINTDLIAVAAEASAPANHGLRHDEVAVWVAKLPLHERDNLLARFIQDDDAHLAAQLRQRIMEEGRAQGQPAVERPRRRAGELLRAAEEHAKAARQRSAKKAATERARRSSQ